MATIIHKYPGSFYGCLKTLAQNNGCELGSKFNQAATQPFNFLLLHADAEETYAEGDTQEEAAKNLLMRLAEASLGKSC